MGKWKDKLLNEIAIYTTGKLNSNAEVENGAYPFFTCSPTTLRIDNYAFDTEALILAGNNANGVFSLNYYNGKFNAYQRTYVIKIKDLRLTDYKFLYYVLKTQLSNLEVISHGTATKYLTLPILNQIPILLPPLPEQKAIASVLSSLDDKIDLLNSENKTLEAMAETLFRQWFVEEADEDWEKCALNDLCSQIASGGTPSTKIESYYNGNINWYSTKELKDNFLYESENKITKEGLDNSSAKLFPAGTVVIAIYAAPTVGRLGILANEASFNQAACGLIANETLCCSEFIYLYLKNQRDELNLMASGSAQQNLNVGKIKSYPAFMVPKDLMNKFKDAIQPNFKKINSNTLQICTLEKLRDTLLPKLMSGEVGIRA